MRDWLVKTEDLGVRVCDYLIKTGVLMPAQVPFSTALGVRSRPHPQHRSLPASRRTGFNSRFGSRRRTLEHSRGELDKKHFGKISSADAVMI